MSDSRRRAAVAVAGTCIFLAACAGSAAREQARNAIRDVSATLEAYIVPAIEERPPAEREALEDAWAAVRRADYVSPPELVAVEQLLLRGVEQRVDDGALGPGPAESLRNLVRRLVSLIREVQR